jgi:hypothetical protein
MSIKLEYILKRNKSNLKTFIEKNKLTSYNELVEYCKTRKFIPCTESEYTSVVQVKLEAKNEPKVNREVSETQKPKNVGIVVKNNKIHPSYLTVLTKGKLEEWHILSVVTDN